MNTSLEDESIGPSYVSTGHLLPTEQVWALVGGVPTVRTITEGKNSGVLALARVPRELFGIRVVGTSGNVHAVGGVEHEFTCHYVLAVIATAGLYETRATGSTKSACLARAGSTAESSPYRRVRARSGPCPAARPRRQQFEGSTRCKIPVPQSEVDLPFRTNDLTSRTAEMLTSMP